ncbi:BCCT family transporter [Mesonia aestuariivivens]|uniref:BCCT family transporter n=1 Tax=Mesonia aestuariivivens TaxID=2796128 RepID=A0ABS6W2Z6_9FLAO|nr:BCCT family transporter [Mesonia aestuariivivens]MBW2962184.1 BCCT family transporter [Mesonia aestuariivivens]
MKLQNLVINKILQFLKNNLLLSISIVFILALSILIFSSPETFYSSIESYSISIRNIFGSFYLWLGLGCVLFLLILAFTPFGKIRLGGTKPEYKTLSWISMLYSAGMGAGILLRAVQEPVFMQQNSPISTTSSAEVIALEYTFYQWGFTAWAFYVFFALVMGYYLFVRKKSMLLSNAFPQFEGSKLIKGVDLLTVLTTVIGIVAAIGLGTAQIEGGLTYLLDTENNYYFAYIFTFIIFLLGFISAYRGIHQGIQKLSNWNIALTFLLLIFIFVQSDILQILENFGLATYHYVIDFLPLSLALGNYNPGKEFLTDWTLYYWAFWLAWAPFTGVFIARISKGRSIRQIILGGILIPSLGSFLWFSVFGTSSFQLIEAMGNYNGGFDNVFTSIFVFLEAYPLATFTSIITIVLLVGFLITSVDSAIYVLSMFTDKGKQNPKKTHRLIWAILMFIFTEAILILGNFNAEVDVLTAMQKLLIITSLPFALLSVLIGIRLVKDFRTLKT